MSKVWGFGCAAMDLRIITAEYGADYRDKLLAQELFCLGGGAVANCLTQVSRLGSQCGWLGKLGNDLLGRQILKSLEGEGIDCTHVVFSDTEISSFNLAVYAGQEKRRIGGFMLPNALASLEEKEIAELSLVPVKGDWLALEIGEIPIPSCIRFARSVKSRGVRIAVDIDLDPIKQCKSNQEEVNEMFSLADILIPNGKALASLCKSVRPEELCLQLFSDFSIPVVITAGKEGAFYIGKDGRLCHQRALPTNVQDTVGAGDAFHGGLLHILAEGGSLSEAVLWGTVCASKNCEVFGAREGMPYKSSVLEYIDAYGNKNENLVEEWRE